MSTVCEFHCLNQTNQIKTLKMLLSYSCIFEKKQALRKKVIAEMPIAPKYCFCFSGLPLAFSLCFMTRNVPDESLFNATYQNALC